MVIEAVPVVYSLDYHANVTPAMVTLGDGVQAYRTYPHIDRVDTGVRAARLLREVLANGRPAGRALRKPGFLLPLNDQCTQVDPSRAIVERAAALEGGAVLSVSYLAGFPPADLHDAGPSVVVYARTQAAADAAADALTAEIERREAEFAQPMLDPDAAVREAMRIAQQATRPVVIADTQDNPGAGGTGDTTGMLAALVRNRAQGAVLGFLLDPDAAQAAQAAGEGSSIELALGGRHGPEGCEPYRACFRVERLGDGRMTTTGPSVGGRRIDLGPMALLAVDGVRVVVTSRRMQAHDQAPFRHLGIEPAEQRILVLKSTVHFRADFQPLAEAVLVALAPGGHGVAPTRYPYRRLRAGVRLHPLGPAHDPARTAGAGGHTRH